jgi:hypothetical protein
LSDNVTVNGGNLPEATPGTPRTVSIDDFESVTANNSNTEDADTVSQIAIDFALQTTGNWTSI